MPGIKRGEFLLAMQHISLIYDTSLAPLAGQLMAWMQRIVCTNKINGSSFVATLFTVVRPDLDFCLLLHH